MRYQRPFALLEPNEYLAGLREVWTSTFGRAKRYHVLVEDGMAACRSNPYRGVILCENTIIPIGEVPGHMCCLRSGCRELFLAAIS